MQETRGVAIPGPGGPEPGHQNQVKLRSKVKVDRQWTV